jgi:hypothetical protein
MSTSSQASSAKLVLVTLTNDQAVAGRSSVLAFSQHGAPIRNNLVLTLGVGSEEVWGLEGGKVALQLDIDSSCVSLKARKASKLSPAENWEMAWAETEAPGLLRLQLSPKTTVTLNGDQYLTFTIQDLVVDNPPDVQLQQVHVASLPVRVQLGEGHEGWRVSPTQVDLSLMDASPELQPLDIRLCWLGTSPGLATVFVRPSSGLLSEDDAQPEDAPPLQNSLRLLIDSKGRPLPPTGAFGLGTRIAIVAPDQGQLEPSDRCSGNRGDDDTPPVLLGKGSEPHPWSIAPAPGSDTEGRALRYGSEVALASSGGFLSARNDCTPAIISWARECEYWTLWDPLLPDSRDTIPPGGRVVLFNPAREQYLSWPKAAEDRLVLRDGWGPWHGLKLEVSGSAYEIEDAVTSCTLKCGREVVETYDMPGNRGLNSVILDRTGRQRLWKTFDVYGDLDQNNQRDQWNAWAAWIEENAKPGDVIATASFDAMGDAPAEGAAYELLEAAGARQVFRILDGDTDRARTPYALVFVHGADGSARENVTEPKGDNAHILMDWRRDLLNKGSFHSSDIRDDEHRLWSGTWRLDRLDYQQPTARIWFDTVDGERWGEGLCDAEGIKNIQISTADSHGNALELTQLAEQTPPCWELTSADGLLFGGGGRSKVELRIDGLELPNGKGPGLANLYLELNNVEGSLDGTFTLPIQKVVVPSVDTFTGENPKVVQGSGGVTFCLDCSWAISGWDPEHFLLLLDGRDVSAQTGEPDSDTGSAKGQLTGVIPRDPEAKQLALELRLRARPGVCLQRKALSSDPKIGDLGITVGRRVTTGGSEEGTIPFSEGGTHDVLTGTATWPQAGQCGQLRAAYLHDGAMLMRSKDSPAKHTLEAGGRYLAGIRGIGICQDIVLSVVPNKLRLESGHPYIELAIEQGALLACRACGDGQLLDLAVKSLGLEGVIRDASGKNVLLSQRPAISGNGVLRVVQGVVVPSGVGNGEPRLDGEGYSVEDKGNGVFSVRFLKAFGAPPTVVATQIYPGTIPFQGGDTRDNVVVISQKRASVVIKTGGSDGNGDPREFAFIAIGPA